MNGDKRDALDERQLLASKQPENLCSSPFTLAPGASAGVSGESEFPYTLSGNCGLPTPERAGLKPPAQYMEVLRTRAASAI